MFETVLSAIDKVVVTFPKSTFPKSPPIIIPYRSYKNFSKDLFRDDLNSLLSKENMTLDFTSLANFTKIFIDTLSKLFSNKEKIYLQKPCKFCYKYLHKTILLRSRLRNILLKETSLESKKAYNKKQNICVKMVKKAKEEHYQNISLSQITDNKKFWKTISPLFGNKVKTSQKVNLIKKNILVTSDVEIAQTFMDYFDEILPKLNIIQNQCYKKQETPRVH